MLLESSVSLVNKVLPKAIEASNVATLSVYDKFAK
jgi:hypothetical protein